MSAPRVAFVRVRELPLAALLRTEPELARQPVAVVDGTRPGLVRCCTAAARALGVRPGQTAHQARAVAPDLRLRALSPDAVRAARAALTDAVAVVSPRVEPARDGVYVDLAGLGHLHPTEGGTAEALAHAARRVGLDAAVAIASSKGVARIAAGRRAGATVVAPGDEARFLAPLALDVLALSPELHADLLRFGITRLGELARLPLGELGRRLGEEAARAVRLAAGEDDAPLVPRPLPMRFEESMDFDWELVELEPLLFATRRLLDALVARLQLRGFGVAKLVLALALVTRVQDERVVEVAAPTREVPTLVRLVRASLQAHPPLDAVVGARIVAVPGALRPVQLGLFDPPGPAPERLALTLTRLVALVGDGRVGAPVAPDTHRPHAVAMATFDPPRGRVEGSDPRAAPAMALHVFRPPRDADVQVQGGAIVRVRSGEIAGRVVACGGPWRVAGEWWADAFEHDGYDVELDDGGIYLVAYDRARDAWRLEGVYE